MKITEVSGGVGCVLVVVLCVALLVGMPFLLIWAVNTLFGLSIAYTFKTWLAMLLVSATVSGGAARSGNSG